MSSFKSNSILEMKQPDEDEELKKIAATAWSNAVLAVALSQQAATKAAVAMDEAVRATKKARTYIPKDIDAKSIKDLTIKLLPFKPDQRASATIEEGTLSRNVMALREHLHQKCEGPLHEEDKGTKTPIIRPDPPHIELINPKMAVPYPKALDEEDMADRQLMWNLAGKCRPSHFTWLEGGGTGEGTTATFALALTGRPHLCRGLHISVARARRTRITDEDRMAIVRETEMWLEDHA